MHDKGKFALALARMGFKVFPIQEDSKLPALKGDWKQHATTDEAQIESWWSEKPYNIGVATLPGSDLVILDYDMKEGQNGAAALRTHELLDIPKSLRVKTPSGGLHIYFKTDKVIPNSASKIAQNVDVRGNERGGYVLGPGSTIAGKPYAPGPEWANGQREELPDWLHKLATTNRKKTATKQGEILGELDTPDSIARATEWLKAEAPEAIEGSGGNNTTFQVASRVKDFGVSQAACVELLLDVWNETKAAPSWSPDELETIVGNAYRYGSLPVGVSNAKAEFEAAGLIFEDGEQHEKPQPKRGLYLVDAHEGADAALEMMAEPLIDEVLDCEALSVLYGPSGSGKTFVALDLAFSVATGDAWHGNRTVKQGLVIYVATEGGRGIFKRLAALKRARGFPSNIPFAVVPCPVDLLTSGKESDTRKLVALIRAAEAKYGRKAELIIIDTLSRALAGGDENASTDMGTFIKHVDRIRAESKAHVMVVHHTGKDTSKGARGWSGMRAATDNELEVLDGKLSITKQRDDAELKPIAFRLKSVEIGQRKKDGKVVTSCVVDWRDAPEFDVQLSDKERRLFNALIDLAKKNATEGATEVSLRTSEILEFLASEECHDFGRDIEVNRTAIANGLSSLSEKGVTKKLERGQWVIPLVTNVT